MRGGEKKLIFSSPSSPASGKMPRSPHLAHKAPVMFYNALLVLYGLDKPSFTAKLRKKIALKSKQFES